MTEKIAAYLVNLIANYPFAIVWFLGVFVIATLTNSGIKGTWAYAEMPRWARFVLAFTMPLALNFYHFGEKVGLQQPPDVQTLTSATVRVAVAADEAARAAAEKKP
jgi:hypothetical protein